MDYIETKPAIEIGDTSFNEEYFEDKYYKYVAEWIKLSYEEQCEIPILTFDKWKKREVD